jgi:hypothetical protein
LYELRTKHLTKLHVIFHCSHPEKFSFFAASKFFLPQLFSFYQFTLFTMSESLDMSTASMLSSEHQSHTSHSQSSSIYSTGGIQESNTSSPPPLPESIIESPPLSRKQQKEQGKTPPTLPPLPVDYQHSNSGDKSPPTRAFIMGHARYFAKTSLQFIFKDNNLPLLINIIYHLVAARSLIFKPFKTVTRYVTIQPILLSSSSPLRYQIEQTTAIAMDSFRALGVLHLALGVLSALALKERRQSSERSALLVLTLSSIGQTWAHFNAYWKTTGSQYTLKALQEVGGSNIIMLLISIIALSKTVKRTGRIM